MEVNTLLEFFLATVNSLREEDEEEDDDDEDMRKITRHKQIPFHSAAKNRCSSCRLRVTYVPQSQPPGCPD